MRVPIDNEIQAAAIELGVIKPGERLRPMQRAKVAEAIRIAAADDEPDPDEVRPHFIETITTTRADLVEAGLPSDAADRIVAAIAPLVWRDIHK